MWIRTRVTAGSGISALTVALTSLVPSLRLYSDDPDRLICGCEVERCVNPSCNERGASLAPAGNHALVCHRGLGSQRATILEPSWKGHSGRQTRPSPT